jgi:Common central domain of tyrosinase
MVLGDGIRRNIAMVDPKERALLIDAFIELNKRFYNGTRDEHPPGGVSWWFKQDEIHQATHVHHGPQFLPWHRVIVNRMEDLLRQIHPQLSLHYWDWTQDPRAIPNANLGTDVPPGNLNLFTPDFMGYGGTEKKEIGEPWLKAGYYEPGARFVRDITRNPADPPHLVTRAVSGSPTTKTKDDKILGFEDYAGMRNSDNNDGHNFDGLEASHDNMHNFVSMGGVHISFRDPFVFLLHSNVDRLFARWQTDPAHRERLDPTKVYGTESDGDIPVPDGRPQNLNDNVEPWSTGTSFDGLHDTRPWFAPENEGKKFTYKDPSVVSQPLYDTNRVYAVHAILKARGISNPVSLRHFAKDIGLIPPISVRELMRKLV